MHTEHFKAIQTFRWITSLKLMNGVEMLLDL